MAKRPVLYGANGQLVRASAYDATSGSRRLKSWSTSGQGPNALTFENLDKLRDLSRDAVRKNPYAASASESYTANAIGTGIRPVPQHPDPEVRAKLKAAWRVSEKQIDFDGLTDGPGQQALAFSSQFEGGEVLARLRSVPDRGLLVPFQVELIEGEHLPTMAWGANFSSVATGNSVRCGIEVDSEGRRVAYHLYREHPNETTFFSPGGQDTVRIPASEIAHIFRPLRPKQLRGEPWLTRVLVRLWQIDKYDDAELARKVIASSITGFITSSADEDNRPLASVGASNDGNTTAGTDQVEVEPGTFIDLDPDEDVKFAEAAEVGGSYSTFMLTQLRAAATGIGIPYEYLTGDVSQVNYSSIRAALLEFRRRCEQVQYSMFVHQYCHRVYSEWLKYAAIAGVIDRRDYLKNRMLYEDVRWVTQGWPWVDPLKDMTASVMAKENGFTSRATIVAELGEDIEQIDAENRADMPTALELLYGDTAQKKSEIAATRQALLSQPEEQPRRAKEIVQ